MSRSNKRNRRQRKKTVTGTFNCFLIFTNQASNHSFLIYLLKKSIITRAWTVQNKNLRFLSKLNHNTVRWFQASFRRVLGVLVTWWCFMIFVVIFRSFFPTLQNSPGTTKSSAPLKLFGNHPMVFWLNFEKNRRFLFSTVQALNISQLLGSTFMPKVKLRARSWLGARRQLSSLKKWRK